MGLQNLPPAAITSLEILTLVSGWQGIQIGFLLYILLDALVLLYRNRYIVYTLNFGQLLFSVLRLILLEYFTISNNSNCQIRTYTVSICVQFYYICIHGLQIIKAYSLYNRNRYFKVTAFLCFMVTIAVTFFYMYPFKCKYDYFERVTPMFWTVAMCLLFGWDLVVDISMSTIFLYTLVNTMKNDEHMTSYSRRIEFIVRSEFSRIVAANICGILRIVTQLTVKDPMTAIILLHFWDTIRALFTHLFVKELASARSINSSGSFKSSGRVYSSERSNFWSFGRKKIDVMAA
ncbi:hypothetical protein BKA69DRAFT_489883 [Paraphysoderma sedebokerense]|nr:hypothetical protein BKA69DRAFT_489883 [Paraphysoderma sedebokerense]